MPPDRRQPPSPDSLAEIRAALLPQSALLCSTKIVLGLYRAARDLTVPRRSSAKRRQIFIRELANERFILNDRKYSPSAFDKIIALCAEAGFSPRIGATATVSSGVVALVEAGEGLAILPQGSRALANEELIFVPLADRSAFIDLVIAWSPQHETPVLHSFLELARKRRKDRQAHRSRYLHAHPRQITFEELEASVNLSNSQEVSALRRPWDPGSVRADSPFRRTSSWSIDSGIWRC
jgi:hypothetical protein